MEVKFTILGCYDADRTLFDGIMLPPEIDHDTLVNNILLEGAEFEVQYPNVPFFKEQIKQWFKMHNREFVKWVDAQSKEYNPIYNYDRYEDSTDTLDGHNEAGANTATAGYNTSTYSPVDKTESSNSDHSTNVHNAHIYGNIGVTTSASMVQEYIKVNAWNIYVNITDMFLRDFTIMVY